MYYNRAIERLTFSSGRQWTPNNGYIGINADMELSEGHDREIIFDEDLVVDRECGYDDHQPLTPEERRELSDYMIGLWQEFKEAG